MLAQKLQSQVPIGSKVAFTLKSGREVSGTLIEIGRDHATLTNDQNLPTTVMLEMVGMWELLTSEPSSERRQLGGLPSELDKPAALQRQRNVTAHSIESGADLAPAPNSQTGQPPNGTSNESAASMPLPSDRYPATLGRVLEIESRFSARIDVAHIDPSDDISFATPTEEFKGAQLREATAIWVRAKNKYEFARKVNELSARFDRTRWIINDLKSLTELVPGSHSAKRLLGYFYNLTGNSRDSLQCYRDAALLSDQARDWRDTAAIALKTEDRYLACYCLRRFFISTDATADLDAWYVYVGLLRKTGCQSLLKTLVRLDNRSASDAEVKLLIETAIYLLKASERDALASEAVQKWLAGYNTRRLLQEVVGRFDDALNDEYRKVAAELDALLPQKRDSQRDRIIAGGNPSEALSPKRPESPQTPFTESKTQASPQGYIDSYKPDDSLGFIQGSDGRRYLFHRSAVVDDVLLSQISQLRPGKKISVVFEATEGPKGPIAVGISLNRTIEEMFKLANRYANDGEYPKAIAQIKRVLTRDPLYPRAQESYDKWREYARAIGVPRGANPYARAKRAQLIEKDLERAVELLRIAITKGDNAESAVKDLASLLVQLGRSEEAVKVLTDNRNRVTNQQTLDNLLIGVYQKAGQFPQAINLLQKSLANTSKKARKVQLIAQIGNCYLGQGDYKNAERQFIEAIRLGGENKAIQRSLAYSLVKQERYDDAERILQKILSSATADTKAEELLRAIADARKTGQSARIDEIIAETVLSGFSREVSQFAQFYLDRCKFEKVPPARVQAGTMDRSDVLQLEDLASRLGSRNPHERAEYYLSAAKIITTLQDWDDPRLFYRFLCRSFASRGDAAIAENRPLDAAREWYCEAVCAYDGDRSEAEKDDRHAVSALVRCLFSSLGSSHIPFDTTPWIDETLQQVINQHPNRDRVFDLIADLTMRSQYAANRLLSRLYNDVSLQAMTLEYLRNQGVVCPSGSLKQEDFVRLWRNLLRAKVNTARDIVADMRYVARVELTPTALRSAVDRVANIEPRLSCELDRHRLQSLQTILIAAENLVMQNAFEEKERLCIQIDSRCQDLLADIEANPTKLSVEEVHSIVETVRSKTASLLQAIYESSVPQLSLWCPLESYTPDANHRIEVQIKLANKAGCSPAESLVLVIPEDDEEYFRADEPEIRLNSSLRGGTEELVIASIQVADKAINSQAFSLPVYAQYRTRSGEIKQTPVENFSIRLCSESEFEPIVNPYAPYAEGGTVGDTEMFYGRTELVANMTRAIENAKSQSKCIVIFGQKRAGKSSVLYHLKRSLQRDKNRLILDLGNIGSLLDEHSATPLLYKILWSILSKLRDAIEDQIDNGRAPLDLPLVRDIDFYAHPSPLNFFKDTFDRFRRAASKTDGWQDVRVTLLIDEFGYIYDQIVSGRIGADFMKNWKALLQENYFSAVLVGQDVMPKFKQRFPNEFGTTQDERVTYLKREDAEALIDEPIRFHGKQGESRYRERAIQRILDLTAGSPFYIQIICNRLVDYMNRKRAPLVTEADVEQVKRELIQGVNPLSKDKFDNLINSGDTSPDAISDDDTFKVLSAIASNSRTGPCSRNSIACETRTPIDVILDDLVKRDVIERQQGQYYQIKVGLFKEWLIAHQ